MNDNELSALFDGFSIWIGGFLHHACETGCSELITEIYENYRHIDDSEHFISWLVDVVHPFAAIANYDENYTPEPALQRIIDELDSLNYNVGVALRAEQEATMQTELASIFSDDADPV